MKFIVAMKESGMLLREFLSQQELSKKAVKLIKMHGKILVNGQRQTYDIVCGTVMLLNYCGLKKLVLWNHIR